MTDSEFADIIVNNDIFPNRRRLFFRLQNLFKRIELKDKAVLDIGGGEGLLSFYSAYKWAKEVVCIEPESQGSDLGTIEKFYRLKDLFQFSNVSLYKGTFQDYSTEAKFDVILMHNSINHLNEQACMNLKFLRNAESEYAGYFKKLFDLADHKALLILSDCSNVNFWDLIKIRNPFAESIEWNKHQSPEIWKDLAQTSGFTFEKLTWSTFNRLGKVGETVLGNRFLSYFLDSHFNLYFTKE